MTLANILWLLAGCLLGSGHAVLVWRAARSLKPDPFVLVRLLATGALLGLAAWLGALIPAAVGWSVAYFATVAVVYWMMPS